MDENRKISDYMRLMDSNAILYNFLERVNTSMKYKTSSSLKSLRRKRASKVKTFLRNITKRLIFSRMIDGYIYNEKKKKKKKKK